MITISPFKAGEQTDLKISFNEKTSEIDVFLINIIDPYVVWTLLGNGD